MDKPILRGQTKKNEIMALQKEQFPCQADVCIVQSLTRRKKQSTLCQVGIGIVGLPYGAK